ncbi:hypothetical protein EYF80_006365 [Liparis tanakae]|uniref:Uncharacterized protein n=1 Tax=Liparis tanakae TaxID=230148 RepID=A0A4Z2J0P4_9TELE|nr:hypothetical protein EYF80_006365 [Liparis tanakae]
MDMGVQVHVSPLCGALLHPPAGARDGGSGVGLTLLQVPLVVPRLLFLGDKLLHPSRTDHRSRRASSSSGRRVNCGLTEGSSGSDNKRRSGCGADSPLPPGDAAPRRTCFRSRLSR